MIRVRAKDLLPGDVLITGEIVLDKYQSKMAPVSKITLALQRREGEIRVVDWGKWRSCPISRGSICSG